MSNFNLMILAAGYGKRMQTLTHNIPKPLLKVNNKELLRHNIEFFINLGCKKIIINTHYLHKEIKYFIKKNFSRININLIFEPELLNTGGGIKNALNYFNNKNFLVTNSDILWTENNEFDVTNFIKKYDEVKACKLLIVENKKFKGLKKKEGDFNLENNLIKRWKKTDPCFYYSGLQIINPSIFNLIKENSFSINLLWDILIKYEKLEGKICNSFVTHIGDISSYKNFNN